MSTNLPTHTSTRDVQLRAMTRKEYNDFRGWQLPADEDGNELGFLVESDASSPVLGDYITWCPKQVADKMYRAVTENLTFSDALRYLKQGKRVARRHWAEQEHLFVLQGSNKLASVHGYGFGEYVNEPTFDDTVFKHTRDNRLVSWGPSHADLLKEDWRIV